LSALAPAGRTKLAKLLGMLGRDHAGERDAAALAAYRLVIQSGATWGQVLPAGVASRQQTLAWRETVSACRRQPGSLKVWERDFLQSLARFQRLSIKQSACLQAIASRVLDQ
jgi:hypothetical protein